MPENLADNSWPLNIAFGTVLFLLSTFFTKYYFIEFLKRIHHRTHAWNILVKGLLQAFFSMIPLLILHAASSEASPADHLNVSVGSTFLGFAAGFFAIFAFSRKVVRIDRGLFNRLAASILLLLLSILTASLSTLAAAGAYALLSVAAVLLFRNLYSFDFTAANDALFFRDTNITSVIDFYKSLFYPFEVLFDNTIVFYGGKSKIHMLNFTRRSFLSPLINAFLLVLYNQFGFSNTTHTAILTGSLLLAAFLMVCSKSPWLYDLITLYSFVVACSYFYIIIREQAKLTEIFSTMLGCTLFKAQIYYLVPQVCVYGQIINSYFFSIGLRQVSIYATVIGTILNLVQSSILSYDIDGLINDLNLRFGLLITAAASIILSVYVNMAKGKVLCDYALIAFIFLFAYYLGLYRLQID